MGIKSAPALGAKGTIINIINKRLTCPFVDMTWLDSDGKYHRLYNDPSDPVLESHSSLITVRFIRPSTTPCSFEVKGSARLPSCVLYYTLAF